MTSEFHTALSVQIEVLKAERAAAAWYEKVYPHPPEHIRVGSPLFERGYILTKQIEILEARLKQL